MLKVTLIQMVYNGMKYIPQSFESMVNQTYAETEIIAVINGNDDGGKDYIAKNFPTVKLIDPSENLRFVRGHNLVFSQSDSDLFQLVNQDLILENDYVEQMVKAFEDGSVGATNGKIYQYNFERKEKSKILDTTGIAYSKDGRGKSRGQHEVDRGQYDDKLDLIGVDGAACMYRRQALEEVRYQRDDGANEYFDLDFEMYWEDVDLSLRLTNSGWKSRFVPQAVGYHGRTASASPGGYKKVLAFINHHRQIPSWIRQYNYRNHIFLFVKNSPKWYWQFFARELAMHVFILIFETSTLKELPKMLKTLPTMLKKRKWISSNRKISTDQFEKLMS